MSSSAKPHFSREEERLKVEGQMRSLLAEGRILEAVRLLEEAGDLVPPDSKIRKVLSPPTIKLSDRRDVDRTPEFRWLDTHEVEYQGKWVALVEDELVASSDTLKELLVQIDQLQFARRPLIHHLI